MQHVSQAQVTHGFLDAGSGERPLFATHHAPRADATPRNIAYVLCLPLHLDLIQSYRSMRVLAEQLAQAGFHVLRVHYDGTGESVFAGDHDEGRVTAWLESVRRAASVMAGLPGIEGVGLIGVRAGGAFALETSTAIDIARLVLWEPSSGTMYGREMEILASSTPQRLQPGTSGEAAPAAGGVVAGGYFLSAETLADLGRLNLEKMEPRGKPDVLLIHRGDRKPSPRLQQHLERALCPTTVVQLAGHKEMMAMPEKSAVPTDIIAAICNWTVQHSSAIAAKASGESGESAEKTVVKLATEAVFAGLRWRVLRFGSGDHLFGILTSPEDGPTRGLPAVLLLTGGVTPRTSGNGSYIELARRLAKKGHAVLRMDVAFIGESGTPDGAEGKGTDPFPASILDDARAGLEQLLSAAASGTKAWVLGLCSGAYAAFQTTLADPRALGVFVVNPVAFHIEPKSAESADAESEGPAVTTTADQLQQMQRYLQVMRDPKSWKKLLSGKADVRHIVNIVGARVSSKLASTQERIAVRLGRAPKGLARDLEDLLARDVKLNLVFSEGDPGHTVLVTELGARQEALVKKGLAVKIFPGADHNFHEMTSRAEWLDWLERTIAG